jgi:hypothetical protein
MVTDTPCTGTCSGDVDRMVDLPCGCQDVFYTDGTACYEHNHVDCDGTRRFGAKYVADLRRPYRPARYGTKWREYSGDSPDVDKVDVSMPAPDPRMVEFWAGLNSAAKLLAKPTEHRAVVKAKIRREEKLP